MTVQNIVLHAHVLTSLYLLRTHISRIIDAHFWFRTTFLVSEFTKTKQKWRRFFFFFFNLYRAKESCHHETRLHFFRPYASSKVGVFFFCYTFDVLGRITSTRQLLLSVVFCLHCQPRLFSLLGRRLFKRLSKPFPTYTLRYLVVRCTTPVQFHCVRQLFFCGLSGRSTQRAMAYLPWGRSKGTGPPSLRAKKKK